MKILRGHAMGLMLLLGVPWSHAQEIDPADPAVIADALSRASTVAVGVLRVGWCLPWIDGWHCSGALHVQEFLYGSRNTNRVLPFRWREHYGSTCTISEKVSRFDRERGIWFAARKDNEWEFSKTMLWGGGPFPVRCRESVIQMVERQR
jgi:hypothetical protein